MMRPGWAGQDWVRLGAPCLAFSDDPGKVGICGRTKNPPIPVLEFLQALPQLGTKSAVVSPRQSQNLY